MLDSILYLTSDEVRAACADLDPVGITREVLARHARGETVLPDESYLSWSPKNGSSPAEGDRSVANPPGARSLGLAGMVDGSHPVAGMKIINANSANPAAGIPRAAGLTVLFDPQTARPICVMEAAHLSALRTASVTCLATELLHVGPIATAALIGAGAQANAHLRLFLARLPGLERVRIHDLEPARAAALQGRHEGDAKKRGIELEILPSAKEAIVGAELIATVTTTTSGYIPFDWLSPGATLVNVSLDDPLPEVVATVDVLVVDDWKLIRNDNRRLLGRLHRQGMVCGPEDRPTENGRKVDATLGDLILGTHPGRGAPEETVLVNPFGLSIEDLALAQTVHEVAKSKAFGRRLPFEG